jgi:phage repressor protein C with HTH and peptisase S24 domain
MSVTDRIREIIEYKNISARQFCIDVGIANGYLDKVKDVGSEKLLKILNTYPEINPEWLLTGKGEMLRKETNLYDINFGGNIQTLFEAKENYDKLQKDQEINLYDINAAANLQTLFELGQQNVIGKLRIPNLPRCDGAIYLRGDSMYPLLKSGDIIIYKMLNNIENITYGEMYLIDYAIDGDDYLAVKYINASDIDNHIRLVSYNQHFGPMDIPLSSVRSIAIVKASVRINTLV